MTWAFIAAILMTSCSRQDAAPSPQESPSQATAVNPADQVPVQGDWVVERLESDVDSLNPILTQNADGQKIVYPNIFESLLFLNRHTLKLEPMLAESWEISPDELTYTFHLRHDVKWHDGVPFTADDVKYSFDTLMDPKVNAAPQRAYFTNVKSCEIIDPYTVKFTATERYFKTLECLGTDYLPMIPKHVFEKGEPDFNKHPANRAPIGTGPYKFVRWDTGSQIVVERNDDYWGGKNHYPKRIVYQIVEESYIAAQLLKKGELDTFDGVSPLIWKYDLEHSSAMKKAQEIVYPYPEYTYLGFNLRLPIFSDIRVRHAIDLLFPRDEILAKIYLNKYANKTAGYDPPGSPTYDSTIQPTPYDPAQALQLLSEAGWKNDHGDGLLYKDGKPLSFTLLYPAGSSNTEKVAELVQESMHQSGVDVKLERLEFAQLIERTEDWQFDSVLAGWTLDTIVDPAQLWNSADADVKKSSNFIGYKDPEADKLIAAGKLEYDDGKRAAIYRQLHKVIHDDYPVCFLFNPHVIMLVADRFRGVNVFGPIPCYYTSTWWVPLGMQKYGD